MKPKKQTFTVHYRHRDSWTKSEDAEITKLYETMSEEEISKITGRSPASINTRLRRIGVVMKRPMREQAKLEAAKKEAAKVHKERLAVSASAYKAIRQETPIEHAERVLKMDGRLVQYRGVWYLDDKLPTAMSKMIELNKILKAKGIPQVGKLMEWMV